jgi:hypothetical protein
MTPVLAVRRRERRVQEIQIGYIVLLNMILRYSISFRFLRYSPAEKIYSVFLFMAGLSLRERT